jgi:hypothetical protein
MSILVRNTKERECSVCHRDISPGNLYIPQCQSRSNRGVHCTTCALIELQNARDQIDDMVRWDEWSRRDSRIWVYDENMKGIGEQWRLELESS